MKNQQATVIRLEKQTEVSPLDQLVREGAQRMLRQAIEAEVTSYIERHTSYVDSEGHRLVVRNGYSRERAVQTGAGVLKICQPRIDDRRAGKRYSSRILPPYLRRSKSIETFGPGLVPEGHLNRFDAGCAGGIVGLLGRRIVLFDDHASERGLARRLYSLAKALADR